MENASIQSKVLIVENSEKSIVKIKEFFVEKGLIGLKASPKGVLELLQSSTDLGAVFLSEESEKNELSGSQLAQKIHHIRPELPIFVRKESLQESDVETRTVCEYYSTNDMDRLSSLVDEHLFSRFYPMPLIRGIQEISQEAFISNIFDIEVTCDPPYLVKDNIIYGELFSLIPLESYWCRGYMMLQTTKDEVLKMISCGKTHLDKTAIDIRDVNGLLNEITNLIWGGIRSRFFQESDESGEKTRTQVPILINHNEKFISFGTAEPQLCFKYTIKDKSADAPAIVIYQKLIFNLDWRPEAFIESDQAVDELVDSGELEFF